MRITLDLATDERLALRRLAAAMLEGAEAIETLRILVGIRRDIELEDAEPEGNA